MPVGMGARGRFAAPSTPREPNVGLEIIYRIASPVCGPPCGLHKYRHARCGQAGLRYADVSPTSPRCIGVSRPLLPHTLRSPTGEIPQNLPRRHLRRLALRVSVDFAETLRSAPSNARRERGSAFRCCAYGSFYVALTPLRRPLRRRRDSPPLPAHGRCRPVTPVSFLFAEKEGK